jgi:cell division protein FtsZ
VPAIRVPAPAPALAGQGSFLGAPVADTAARLPAAAEPDAAEPDSALSRAGRTAASSFESAEPDAPRNEAAPDDAAAPEAAGHPGVSPASETSFSSSYSAAPRHAHAEAPGKTFEVATSRRRPVVFEEDDDLDVPDFLK